MPLGRSRLRWEDNEMAIKDKDSCGSRCWLVIFRRNFGFRTRRRISYLTDYAHFRKSSCPWSQFYQFSLSLFFSFLVLFLYVGVPFSIILFYLQSLWCSYSLSLSSEENLMHLPWRKSSKVVCLKPGWTAFSFRWLRLNLVSPDGAGPSPFRPENWAIIFTASGSCVLETSKIWPLNSTTLKLIYGIPIWKFNSYLTENIVLPLGSSIIERCVRKQSFFFKNLTVYVNKLCVQNAVILVLNLAVHILPTKL
jgi:hypothetical protein